MTQVTVELDSAIKAQDSVKFSQAFMKLTSVCNSCHEAAASGLSRLENQDYHRLRRRRSAMRFSRSDRSPARRGRLRLNNLSDFGSFRHNLVCTFFFAPVKSDIFSVDKRVSIERRALA